MEASLPRDAYVDEATFAVEQERVLGASWVCAGRTDAVAAAAGSFQRLTVAGEKVLLVRADDGSLGAFANRCAHRGAELVDTDVGGRFEGVIRCPYHFWAYGFDGALRASPWVDHIDPAQFGLHRHHLVEWAGFIFVRITDGGPSLFDELGEIAVRLSQYPLHQLRTVRTITYHVAANWKVIAENYNECYHCGPVHPELCDLVPSFRLRGGAQLDWEGGIPHREGADTYTSTGMSPRPSMPGLDDVHQRNHFGELIYPNLMLSLSRDHAAAFVLHPLAADHTRIDCHFLFHPNAADGPEFDPADAVDFWHTVNLQDWSICERVQRGMTSRTFTHGWYAPMEDPSLDLRRWWLPRMGL
jgi:glycine betaine catabolism A